MQFRNKQKVVDVIKNNRRHKKNNCAEADSRHSQQADRDGEASAEIHS